MRRALAPLLSSILAGCGASPPPRDASAPPPSVSARRAGPWEAWSDLERLRALHVTPARIWGVGRDGLVSWDRASRRFAAEVGPDAPGGEVTAVAEGTDGTLYAGLPSGLMWRTPGKRWERLNMPPLTSGVTALAPRRAGGVWVGLPRGLARVEGIQVHVVSERHHVRALETAPDGRVFAATDGQGLVEVSDGALVEHTSGQGLCGNRVRAVRFGGEGRMAVTCAEPAASTHLSLWDEGRWYTYAVQGTTGPFLAASPIDARVVLEVAGAFWGLEPAPPVDPAAPPAVETTRVTVLEAPSIAEPPLPVPPAPAAVAVGAPASTAAGAPASATAGAPASAMPGAPASAVPGTSPAAGGLGAELRVATTPSGGAAPGVNLPPPVPMPEAITTPKVSEAPVAVRRANAVRGGAAGAPRFVARPYPTGVPAGSTITASTVTPDGTAWYALAHQGVLAVRGAQRDRYVSLSLASGDEGRLASDRHGGVLVAANTHRLLRHGPDGWTSWTVGADPALQALTAATDPFDQVWVVAWTPGAKTLRILRGAPGAAFAALGEVPLPWEGTPRAGALVFDDAGTLTFPLFRVDEKGRRNGAGLARIPVTLDKLEVWRAEVMGEPAAGPLLPSDWVNAVVRAPAGDVTYLGTNGGLVRVAGGQVTVFDENNFIDSDFVLDVALDREGRIWAATLEGLGHLKADQWSSVGRPHADDRVHTVAVDAAGQVWVGTEQGLWRLEDGRWRELRAGEERIPGAVRQILFDAQGSRWVLTSQGVLRLAEP